MKWAFKCCFYFHARQDFQVKTFFYRYVVSSKFQKGGSWSFCQGYKALVLHILIIDVEIEELYTGQQPRPIIYVGKKQLEEDWRKTNYIVDKRQENGH